MSEPKKDEYEPHLDDLRSDFGYFCELSTRWKDNDIYGHVNNVVYYSYFDTAANQFLIERGGLDIHAAPVIGIVVESMCRYREAITHPESLCVGVRANRLGNRSVEYGIGIFREHAGRAAALGYFTHVFVERKSMRPTTIPLDIKAALETILR